MMAALVAYVIAVARIPGVLMWRAVIVGRMLLVRTVAVPGCARGLGVRAAGERVHHRGHSLQGNKHQQYHQKESSQAERHRA
jgi:hypothetical protein